MDLQLWTISKLEKISDSLRREIRFYAPLTDHLDFMGIEPVTFIRAGLGTATWRDGFQHIVGVNVPCIDYSGETPLGIQLTAGQLLQFSPANALDDSSTLIWFEESGAKSTPTNTNPFSSQGQWSGNLNIHAKHIVKFNRVLTNAEINSVQLALADVTQTIPTPVPPPAVFGTFIMETPAGTRNGSNITFTLSQIPDVNSLIVVCFGVILERVTSNPGPMQFMLSGVGNKTLTMGIGPSTGYPFFAQYISQ